MSESIWFVREIKKSFKNWIWWWINIMGKICDFSFGGWSKFIWIYMCVCVFLCIATIHAHFGALYFSDVWRLWDIPKNPAHLVCTVNVAKARSIDVDDVMCGTMVRCNVVHSGAGTRNKTEVVTIWGLVQFQLILKTV